MARQIYDFKTGLPIADATELEAAVTGDHVAVCNFTVASTNYTDYVDYVGTGPTIYDVGESEFATDDSSWPWVADNCDRLLVVEHNQYIGFVNGYLSPVIILLTIVNNSLTCVVLLQRNMRTPTNVLLVALAVSDALTGIVPLPAFVTFYSTGRYRSWLVPTAWCHAYPATTLYLPTVWHTTSIWLTVTLAVQRYIYVGYPARAKRLCTVGNAVRAVIVVYVAAMISQLTCFFQFKYTPVEVVLPGVDVPVAACSFRIASFLANSNETYFGLYWYLRVIFINLVPCVLLVAINVRLFLAMREANVRRRQLMSLQFKPNQTHLRSAAECRRLAENNAATLMLLTVVGVFLLVEFPLAVMVITMIVENQFVSHQLMDPLERQTATMFINLVIMLSYPVNFFIYCGMSHQFRQTFRRLFACSSNSSSSSNERPMPAMAAGSARPEPLDLDDRLTNECCSTRCSLDNWRTSRAGHTVMMSLATENHAVRDDRMPDEVELELQEVA